MDKETLSNYGWIVICVLVLAVMLALASPFGKFVSSAVESTTQGLFDVNQGALGAAGIVIDDQSFADTNGDSTESLPAGWAELIAASEDGTYATKYPIGTLVTLELKDGTTADFRVVGIDHDDLADGTGKAHLTLVSENNTLVSHPMNTTDTNAGGWEVSAMRTYLQETYINEAIPSDVISSIKTVTKTSFDYDTQTAQTTSDQLWIPSYTEVGFTYHTSITETEGGSAYAYFTSDASRIKTGTNSSWWLRSAHFYTNELFFIVGPAGKDDGYNSRADNTESGVIGFCI